MKSAGARRGLRDIRTMAGSPRGMGTSRHKAYLRLCCLEMERQRREVERDALLKRAEACKSRCDQIAAEIETLRGVLEDGAGAMPPPPPAPKRRPVEVPTPQPRVIHEY